MRRMFSKIFPYFFACLGTAIIALSIPNVRADTQRALNLYVSNLLLADGERALKTVLVDADGDIAEIEAGFAKFIGSVEGTVNVGTVSGTVNAAITSLPGPSSTSDGAASACYISTDATNNATNCKTTAGNFFGVVRILNTTETVYYLRMYNLTGAPDCSSATGFVETIPIPPASGTGLVGGFVGGELMPTHYSAGIAFCVTGGPDDDDNTNAAVGIFGKILFE